VRHRVHIGIEVFVRNLPNRARAGTELLAWSAVTGCLIFMTWVGWEFALQSRVKPLELLPGSYLYVNMAIPIGSALMIMHALPAVLSAVRGLVHGEYVAESGSLDALLQREGHVDQPSAI
jgi:TRAP-type C4-dicarboxylate transport system permease small subunit